MRWVISGVLLFTGTALLFLLSAGAFMSAEEIAKAATPDPWRRALAPLWKSGWLGSIALVCGSTLVLAGAGLLFWAQPDQRERRQPWRVARILQAAFALNVLLAAVLALITSLALRASASHDTVGHLYLMTVAVTLTGSFLAFGLFWQLKSRWLYGTLVTIHALEVAAVTLVFVNGYGG